MIEESFPWVLLAICLWREARGCTGDEKLAIAHVICNRATDPHNRWPKSIDAVICQPAQFTSMSPPLRANLTAGELSNAVAWPKPGDPHFSECCSIADAFGTATELAPDPTGGANHYYSEPIAEIPGWADPEKLTVKIGVFSFFKL